MRTSVLFVPLLAMVTVVSGGTVPAVAQTASASVSGVVTASADGRPLEGVCVEVVGESFETARTGTDGRYRVTGLPPGDYEVGFNTCAEPLRGFVPEYFRDAPSFESAEVVALRSGQQRTGVDAALDPGATIRGQITDDDSGEPVAGICVLAFDDTGEGFPFGFSESEVDGRYAVENLQAGDYTLSFFDCQDPYLYRDEIYDDVLLQENPDGTGSTPVTVGMGQVREDVDAGMLLGGALRGTVTGSHHGRPIDLVCTGLQEGGGRLSAFALTGVAPGVGGELPAGAFVFGGLRPGAYDVVLDEELCGDDGYQSLPPGQPGTRQVVKGRVTSEVDLVLTPRPSISTVCDTGSGPVSRFRDVDANAVHAPAIDCAADYEIALGRPDGTYRPAGPVLRDQMASFVARTMQAAGVVLPADPRDAFSDDGSSVHHLAINQLAALGVVSGRGDGRYGPTEQVSRAQMATFLVNAYERIADFPLRPAGNAFSDDDGDVHEQRIDKAAAAGLTVGSGAGYSPGAPVRRDQMATFVMRLLDRVSRDTAEASGEGFETFEGSAAPSGVLAAR